MSKLVSDHERAEHVLQAFRKEVADTYEREALDEALGLRDVLTPKLLEILTWAAESPDGFLDSGDGSLAYAAVLLAFWEEPRALPVFLQFARLEEEVLDDLWGDMVTQDFQTFLYRTGKNSLDLLKATARDRAGYVYIRLAALGALSWAVAEERIPRQEMLELCAELFAEEHPEEKTCDWRGQVLGEWMDLHPVEYEDTIRKAFEAGKLDPVMSGRWKGTAYHLKRGSWDKARATLLADRDRWMKSDIHEMTGWWSGELESRLAEKRNLDPSVPELSRVMSKLYLRFGYSELRAYLLGIVSGLGTVLPSHVLKEVLVRFDGEVAEPKDRAEAEEFFRLFIEEWNVLSGWTDDEHPPIGNPKSLETSSDPKGVELAVEHHRMCTQFGSFFRGLDEASTFKDDIQDPDACEAYRWGEAIHERMEALREDISDEMPDLSSELQSTMTGVLHEIGECWPAHFKALRMGLKAQRERLFESGAILESVVGQSVWAVPDVAGPKVSRNDACPCGSGKKFKKCCLH